MDLREQLQCHQVRQVIYSSRKLFAFLAFPTTKPPGPAARGLIAASGREQLEVKSRVISLSQTLSSQEMLCAKGTSVYKLLWMFEYRPLV